MEDIKNKRISKDLIIQIAQMVKDHQSKLMLHYLQYENEQKDYYNPQNDIIKPIVGYAKPKLDISVTTENQTETKEDVKWLSEKLSCDGKKIESISIQYLGAYSKNISNNDFPKGEKAQEDIYITFRNDYASIKFDYQNQSEEYDRLKHNIESLILSAPESYDKTISQKYLRENLPSLSVGLTVGLIISLLLFSFCKFSNINIFINDFVLGDYYVLSAFAISILIGFVIPGKNHQLYHSLKIKKKYTGYSTSKNKALYKDDVSELLNKPEVEIGEFNNNGKIRKEIEKNYSRSKLEVFVLILLFTAFYFFVAKI